MMGPLKLAFAIAMGSLLVSSCGNQADFFAQSKRESTLLKNQADPLKQSEYMQDQLRFADENRHSPAVIDVQSYKLTGQFDWAKRQMAFELKLSVKLLEDADEIVLDSAVKEVTQVQTASAKNLSYRYDLDDKKLVVQLPKKGSGDISLVIRYLVDANTSLHAVDTMAGDPVTPRVVYTTSEPLGAARWMPCHNTPSDRARFSIEMTMPESERLIANGKQVFSQVERGLRTSKFETSYTLPTYLMAFAVGEFTVAETMYRDIPLSLWYRQGLRVDSKGMLDAISKQMKLFETLMVPYPFEKYALVLLPGFPAGGLEHASVTFQTEMRSSRSDLTGDLLLTAHELAHQWFGDLVTVKTWDDLWIKEGMATLLASNASTFWENKNNTDGKFAGHFWVSDGDAVRDPELAPGSKYTSGPYGRSAWFLTQLRSELGEKRFWQGIRKVLNDFAFSAVGTEEFLRSFGLSEQQYVRALATISAKKLPKVAISSEDKKLNLTMNDPDQALFTALSLKVVQEDLNTENILQLSSDHPVSIDTTNDILVMFDTQDVHIDLDHFFSEEDLSQLTNYLLPTHSKLKNVLFSEGVAANVKLQALDVAKGLQVSPEQYEQYFEDAGSEGVQMKMLYKLCAQLSEASEEDQQLWKPFLRHYFLNPLYRGLSSRGTPTGFSQCQNLLPNDFIGLSFERLQTLAASDAFTEAEILYLAEFETSPHEALKIWGTVVKEGFSARAREIALDRLLRHLDKEEAFAFPQDETADTWRAFFLENIKSYKVPELLQRSLRAVRLLGDIDAIAQILDLMSHSNLMYAPWRFHKEAACALYHLSEKTDEGWQGFEKLNKTQIDQLSSSSKAAIELVKSSKESCG